MNILVIGQGGREHAIAWKLQQSEKVTEVFVAPGNGGTELETGCTNVDISSNDFSMIKSFVEENNIELVVVGPEDPLVNGIKDYLSDSNVLVFGPDAKGAQLEGSKIFAKEFLFENNIPILSAIEAADKLNSRLSSSTSSACSESLAGESKDSSGIHSSFPSQDARSLESNSPLSRNCLACSWE